MLLFYAGIKSVPKELIEAAQVDGATPGQINTKIIIPQIKPIIRMCLIFAIVGSFKTFDMIDHDINRASNHEQIDWNGVLHEACRNVYTDGGTTYSPTITQNGTSYEIEFNHPTGGWAVGPNRFLKMAYYLQDRYK